MRKCSTRCCPFDKPAATISVLLLVAYRVLLSAGIGILLLVAYGMSLVADCMSLSVACGVLFLAYGVSLLVIYGVFLLALEVAYGVLLPELRRWFFLGADFAV